MHIQMGVQHEPDMLAVARPIRYNLKEDILKPKASLLFFLSFYRHCSTRMLVQSSQYQILSLSIVKI